MRAAFVKVTVTHLACTFFLPNVRLLRRLPLHEMLAWWPVKSSLSEASGVPSPSAWLPPPCLCWQLETDENYFRTSQTVGWQRPRLSQCGYSECRSLDFLMFLTVNFWNWQFASKLPGPFMWWPVLGMARTQAWDENIAASLCSKVLSFKY